MSESPPMKVEEVSPKEFLKARRPERFSDSAVEDHQTLDRAMLEYHLDTLTSRSQEVKFATFARHLAEREICPNLLPQTGPTGGGDSKVDSETYPVADDICVGWCVGIGRDAASERWAFAFSAKKKWADKVRSDVASVADTRRGYRKAFFVSNQFIADKARAKLEDELRREHRIDVRILDRTWILDKVFTNGREALAIEDLELATSVRKEIRKGPLDTQRERDLEELERRISEALAQQRFGPQLVEDCIDAADLARQLERPRVEIDGRFDRAEQVAAKYGTEHQRLKCAYDRACTAFWWHEDYEEFAEVYGTAEERAVGSQNVYHLELLSNLWVLLHGSVMRNKLDKKDSAYQKHTETLVRELERLSQVLERQSTTLQSKTLLLLVSLYRKFGSGDSVDPVLQDLSDIVHHCERVVGFPMMPLIKLIAQVGEVLHGVAAYDRLFHATVQIASTRQGEISAARMLLERGSQQLAANRPSDAIRTLGAALARLHKHESRQDAVRALYLCGCAYERVGLLWAARGTLLSAASLATFEFWRYGEVELLQAICYRRLKWLELQLGRLPQALAWHEVDAAVTHALIEKGTEQSHVRQDIRGFDMALGILFLKTDFWELKRLSTFPDVLDRLGLPASSLALLYALGYEEELRDEHQSEFGGDEDLRATALRWRDYPGSEDLPTAPLLYEERKVALRSDLLGCSITIQTENASPCLELAESVLAALEALLSTGTVDLMAAREPVLTMVVRKSDFAERPFEFELDDSTGRPHFEIICADFSPHSMVPDMQQKVKEKLVVLLATAFGRVVLAHDPVETFERLVRDDLALDRSLCFTGSFVTVGNVHGYHPKNRVSDWSAPNAREYPPKRFEPWDASEAPVPKLTNLPMPSSEARPGEGEPFKELLDHSATKHSEIQTVSLIREVLWDKAGWSGTGFAVPTDQFSVPVLIPIFNNRDAAEEIFAHWREELGSQDKDERLRVAVVRGISKRNPHWYRVVIGSNPNLPRRVPVRYMIFVARVNTMTPDSSWNLDNFLQSYRKAGSYLLVAGTAARGESEPLMMPKTGILKRELHVREAWQIGRNDPDSAAIDPDWMPIIPADRQDAPVLDLLQWKR